MKFTEGITKALAAQQLIGWNKVLKGYLSSEWRSMSSSGIYENDQFHKGRGHQATKSFLSPIHQLITSIWLALNCALHGDSSMAMRQIREQHVTEITEYDNNRDNLLPGDRHYCELPLTSILENASTSRRWLRFMREARHRFLVDGKSQTLITIFSCNIPSGDTARGHDMGI
jgi:hypothetical protein